MWYPCFSPLSWFNCCYLGSYSAWSAATLERLISVCLTALAGRPGCGRRPGPLQVTVVVAVRCEDHHRVFVLPLLVGLQGSREGVELGIAVIGCPVHACCLGVRFTPAFLHPPVGGGADLAQLLLHGSQDLGAPAF